MLGESAVGKTSILTQLVDRRFDPSQSATIGANYQIYSAEIDDLQVEVQIWDTAGQERFRSLGPIYYRNALGAVVVFDITNRSSFTSIQSWIDAFTSIAGSQATIAIVSNKIDLENLRMVSTTEAQDYARAHGFLAFETSAATGKGVQELFSELTETIVRSREIEVPKKTPTAQQAPASQGCEC
jgi:small GTP-binding protein